MPLDVGTGDALRLGLTRAQLGLVSLICSCVALDDDQAVNVHIRFLGLLSDHRRGDASDIDPTSNTDFGAATHPGVGGGTHRRRATFDRC